MWNRCLFKAACFLKNNMQTPRKTIVLTFLDLYCKSLYNFWCHMLLVSANKWDNMIQNLYYVYRVVFGWVLFGQWKSLVFWTLCHWSLFLHSSEKNLLQCRNEYVFYAFFFFLTHNYIIVMIHIDFLNTITFICKAKLTSFLSLAAYIN